MFDTAYSVSPEINPASNASECLHNDACHGLQKGRKWTLEIDVSMQIRFAFQQEFMPLLTHSL
jgi:hypothetical protein